MASDFTADRGDRALRLDLMLRRHLTTVSAATRTQVQRWIEEGRVSVNGRIVRRVATRTMPGDAVSIELPAAPPAHVMAAEASPLQVLHEDAHLLVVNKPAGTVSHPAYRNLTGTLMNAILWHARHWPTGLRPSLAGRLDKMTSGLVAVAKSAPAHTALQRALGGRVSEKDYLALVWGDPPEAGELDWRLRRDPLDRRRVAWSRSIGAASCTRFERLLPSRTERADVSLVRCRLVTGRTHQIRAHLAAAGWPILGDDVYGPSRRIRPANPALAPLLQACTRQLLHAWRLCFQHPFTGETLTIEAPPPDDLRDVSVSLFGSRALDVALSPHGTVPQRVAHAEIHQQ